MSDSSKTPTHLWIVGVLAVLWNAFGCYDYLMTQTQNEAYMSAFTPEQLEFFYGFPAWVVAVWATAVWGALLGSVLLLLKKRLAVTVFAVSIVCMFISMFHNYVLSNGFEIMGGAAPIAMTAVIVVVSLGLWYYAKKQAEAGVLS